jgi:sterol desaturase/sphingolipid hydroxylase (fatty acid hydroxylase superfamily)
VLGSVVIVLLLAALAATWPIWPYSREWGYLPVGAVALALVVVLILAFFGYLSVRSLFAA